MKKYRVAIITNSLEKLIVSENFNTIEDAENYILQIAVLHGIKKAKIRNKNTQKDIKVYNKEDFE